VNLYTIATGLATTFGTVTATNGAETETATATADLPDSIGKLALLIYPPETGSLEIGVSARRDDVYTFMVRLLRDPTSVPARTRWLYAWFNAMRDKIVTTGIHLGITPPPDIDANAVAMRAAIDGEKYSSATGEYADYDVVEVQVDIRVNEHVAGITV
jgi:hypothetical protein